MFNMRMGLGLGVSRYAPTGGGSPVMTFTGGVDGNVSEIRVIINANCTITSSGGITLCSTNTGDFSNSLELESGSVSFYMKTDGTDGTIFFPKNTITSFGIGSSLPYMGWRYDSGGSASGLPDMHLYLEYFDIENFKYLTAYLSGGGSIHIHGELPKAEYIIMALSNIYWETDWDTNGIGVPDGLKRLYLNSCSNVEITYSGQLPFTLIYLYVYFGGSQINGSYSLPTDIYSLRLEGDSEWNGWGNQESWTCSSRVLGTDMYVSVNNYPASVADTQNWVDKANAIAEDGTNTLVWKKTATVGDGVDVSALTAKGYTITLGS